jgi:hypothetical protein
MHLFDAEAGATPFQKKCVRICKTFLHFKVESRCTLDWGSSLLLHLSTQALKPVEPVHQTGKQLNKMLDQFTHRSGFLEACDNGV